MAKGGMAKGLAYENPYNEIGGKEDQGEGEIYFDPNEALRNTLLMGDMTSTPNSEATSGIFGGPEPDHASPMNVGFSPFKRAGNFDGGIPSTKR
jgi:hypothetical protein